MKRIVVNVATVSNTNITGLRIRIRGSSCRKASPIAGTRILGSAMDDRSRTRSTTIGFGVAISIALQSSVDSAGMHREVLDDRSERKGREINETANDQDDADQKADEQS